MKKQVLASLASLGLIATMLLGGSPLFADEMVVNQDTDLTANPAAVTVTAEVGGQYTVTIPKELKLTLQADGSYQCDYTVDVDGVIAENSYISVVPQNEIMISQEGKEDVAITVTQGVQKFRSTNYSGDIAEDTAKIITGEGTPEATGNLSVKEGYTLTSGNWAGTLLFDINLNFE